MMKRIFSIVVGKFTPTTTTRHLGRWEHRISDKQRDTKITWANSDHCGDVVCGKPENIAHNIRNLSSTSTKEQ